MEWKQKASRPRLSDTSESDAFAYSNLNRTISHTASKLRLGALESTKPDKKRKKKAKKIEEKAKKIEEKASKIKLEEVSD